jgi:hypothetical protein
VNSKVDPKLSLQRDGSAVTVTGPIKRWDADEDRARFTVVIAQLQSDGSIVVARGLSNEYERGADSWEAIAHVEGAGRFSEDTAKAWALASIVQGDGYKLYPWWVSTSLSASVTAAAS